MQIQITPEDFKNASYYADSHNCPLACALKRVLGHDKLIVGGTMVFIRENSEFRIKDIDSNCSFKCQTTGKCYTSKDINDLVDRAKRGKDVPTIDIELI